MKKFVLMMLALALLLPALAFAEYEIGSVVTFGAYPQTAAGDDETPVEWIVLDRDGDRALLISRYLLDAQPYNEAWMIDIPWEDCMLRGWLNGEFADAAFTADERKAVIRTDIDNGGSQNNSGWYEMPANDTRDAAFLLSYAEAGRYFADPEDRMCAPTAYAAAQGARTSEDAAEAEYTEFSGCQTGGRPAGWWWLRSPGANQRCAANVNYAGSRDFEGISCVGGVRPALWVELGN